MTTEENTEKNAEETAEKNSNKSTEKKENSVIKRHHKELTFEAQTAHYISTLAKPVIGVAVVFLIAVGAYLGYGHYQAQQETKLQDELFSLQKDVEDKVKKLETDAQEKAKAEAAAKNKTVKGKAKNSKEVDAKEKEAPVEVEHTPEILAANFADDFKKYDSFIQAHQHTKAGYIAAINAARLASDYKDFARAEKILKLSVAGLDATDVFAGLLLAQLSTALIEQNKCTEAEGELNKIADNKSQSYFHSAALLRLGACYIQTKEWDKGMTALTRVEKEFANTQAAGDAKQLKRLLILKRGTAGAKS